MTIYATHIDLVDASDGQLVADLARGAGGKMTYRDTVDTVADLSGITSPADDDVAGVRADGLLYHYSGSAWGTLEAYRLDQALKHASGLVDASLAQDQTIPLSPIPTVVIGLVVDLALFRLGAPDWEARADAAQQTLRALQRGELSLGFDDDTPGGVDIVEWSSTESIMGDHSFI